MTVPATNPFSISLDASSSADRAKATAVAIEALRRVFDRWEVTNLEAARLMGVSERTWNRMKGEAWSGTLSQDQLLRASALIGVFKGLHLYFSDALADEWVRLANTGPVFQGRRPLDSMIEGGVIGIYGARDYLDALRGGL